MMEYFNNLQKMAQCVVDHGTRTRATVELREHMKSPGFNEHSVVDLMLMCYAIGKATTDDMKETV